MKTELDYNKFKITKYNRSINEAHVSKLIKSNQKKDLFHLFPIIVDKNMNVIDGQHRLKACQYLGKPVFYLVSETDASPDLIMDINKNSKPHSLSDKIDIALLSGNKEIKKAVSIWSENKEISRSVVVEMLYTFGSGGKTKTAIENETYKVIFEEEWKYISKMLVRLKTSKKYSSSLIRAVAKIYQAQGQDKLIKFLFDWDTNVNRPNALRNWHEFYYDILLGNKTKE